MLYILLFTLPLVATRTFKLHYVSNVRPHEAAEPATSPFAVVLFFVAPACIRAFFCLFISSNYTTYESSTRISNLFGVHPDFFLRGEGCEQVVGFPGFGIFVVISFAAGQLWNEVGIQLPGQIRRISEFCGR